MGQTINMDILQRPGQARPVRALSKRLGRAFSGALVPANKPGTSCPTRSTDQRRLFLSCVRARRPQKECTIYSGWSS